MKNYLSTIILVTFLVAGGICGIFWPSVATFIKPVGDIFLNLLFTMVVPLVFFSISVSFMKLKAGTSVGKTLLRIFCSFIAIWVTLGVFTYLSTLIINPLGSVSSISSDSVVASDKSWGEALVDTVSVSDFTQLFSKNHLLPLMIFSALLGVGVSLCGERANAFSSFLESGNAVITSTIGILMKVAPIGLGCYFAGTVAETGSLLLEGYLRIFIIYWILAIITVAIIFPAVIRVKQGPGAIKSWWSSILAPSLTALTTASSSVAIPGNIEAAKRLGSEPSVAETTVPLSTNLLKAGSLMGYVLKIVFLMTLCGIPSIGIGPALMAIGISILSASVIGAISGGDVTGAVLTCTLLGVSPEMGGILIIIGTIIDIPATLVNSQSTVVATMMVANHKK